MTAMTAIPLSDLAGSGQWQEDFLRVLPAIKTHAAIRFRKVPARDREEKIAETIAAACASYQRLAVRGQLHQAYVSSLANFSARHTAEHRHVGGHQDGARDVMSPVCQRNHGFEVGSCDNHRPHPSMKDGSAGWKRIAVEDRKANIPDLAAFRIDFADWLNTLTGRDQKIIDAMTSGDGTFTIADRFGISAARISQLRRKFEREWRTFQGEAA